ncbi:MAG: response regulator [Sedimentisphaerales bacterium]|nr:response regulator [Sedimentisphaerales bacterium]
MAKAKILVIEDDPDISGLVSYNLKESGYDIISTTYGNRGLALAKKENPDLIVLDVMVSSADGFEIYKQLKLDESTKYTPVIILGAETQDEDKVVGLEFDVNDYVTTPFSPMELIERIKVVMRRIGLEENVEDVDELGDTEYVNVDDEKHEDK